jgi:hypothetical protein
MAQSVVLAKPEREPGWQSTRRARKGIELKRELQDDSV